MVRRPLVPVLIGCVILALACGKDESADTGIDLCDASTPTLEARGGFAEESIHFTWTGDRNGSWGPWIYRRLPDDLVSVGLSVDGGPAWTGFGMLALNDEVYIDLAESGGWSAWGGPPFYHYATPGAAVIFPINRETEPANGACLALWPTSADNVDGEEGTLRLVARTGAHGGAINLNIVLVGNVEIYQEELDEAVARIQHVWNGAGGPTVGSVELWTLEGDASPVFDDYLEITSAQVDGATQSLNFFLISYFSDSAGTLGVAAGIPGPVAMPGAWGSGVVVAVDEHLNGAGTALDTSLLGETMAHEGGHQMGLFHTTESDGSRYDRLGDTADCPASADRDNDNYFSAEECRDYDGANFMFWVSASFTQDEITADQTWVLNRSPAAE